MTDLKNFDNNLIENIMQLYIEQPSVQSLTGHSTFEVKINPN